MRRGIAALASGKTLAAAPGLKIVAVIGELRPHLLCLNVMENILQAHPKVDAVRCR